MAFLDEPRMWRLRAEEARAAAENMTDPVARDMMRDVADSYDKLAEHAERHRAPAAPIGHPH